MNGRLSKLRERAQEGGGAAQLELARTLWRKAGESENQERAEALSWFRRAAASGEPEHQMEFGMVLCWDVGDYRSGLRWVKRAAKQGHLGAQYFLAAELATGEQVSRNLPEAIKWYRIAAKAGHHEAQYNLALMLWNGEGVRKSRKAAHSWLEAAAKGGELLALRALAEAYSEGLMGYRQDPHRAKYWRNRYRRAQARTS